MSDAIETVETIVDEAPEAEPVDPGPIVPMDCDPSEWKISEQLAYREKTGVNPQYAMLMIGKAFEDGNAEQFTNVDPAWLLGIAWITARRTDKFVKWEKLADSMEYSVLLNSLLAWAESRGDEDPTPAPRKARRK